jgi:hypothetical protein
MRAPLLSMTCWLCLFFFFDYLDRLVYVPGFTTCREGRYEAAEYTKPFQDRLTEAFPDTRILVYGYSPDITKCFSAGTLDSETISNAAVLLLAECRRIETDRRSCHLYLKTEVPTLTGSREPRSLVFACSGLGGLIVKKVRKSYDFSLFQAYTD